MILKIKKVYNFGEKDFLSKLTKKELEKYVEDLNTRRWFFSCR